MIWQGGEYFTVHGACAYYVADAYFHTRVDVRWSGEPRLATVNLRPAKAASVVSDAVRAKGMRVEVWSRGGGGEWTRIKEGSPANSAELEDLMGAGHEESAVVMAVSLAVVNQQRVGTIARSTLYPLR